MKKTNVILNPLNKGQTSCVDEFAVCVLKGLLQNRKSIQSKFFYDDNGSRLFCKIMNLPEYYPALCETEILQNHSQSICEVIGDSSFDLVELGAGDGKKTKILIEQFLKNELIFRYIPVDISESAVDELSDNMNKKFDNLIIKGLVSEYYSAMKWVCEQNSSRNIVLFLGSSIGNFEPDDMNFFLSNLRQSVNRNDFLLIGFDKQKDIDIIINAYNDGQGITEKFNKNLLYRINRELDGNFNPDKFFYHCEWDKSINAVMSYLVSREDQEVRISLLNKSFYFKESEMIHTETSCKFTEHDIYIAAEMNGFRVVSNYYDNKGFFIDSLWEAV